MSLTQHLDAITALSDEYRTETPPAPKSVKIELTSRCNFKCSFCARNIRKQPPADMDWKLYTRLVLEMREIGVQELGLFYLGESFLSEDLPQAIWFAKHRAKFPYVFLTTNGSVSTPDRVQLCMGNGLDSLKFSLNWADKEQFTEVTGVKPSMFDHVAHNIKAARQIRDDYGFPTKLYGSYIQYDGEQAERMKARVDELAPYLDEVYALPLYNQGASVENPDWTFSQGNRGRIGALRDPLPCWSIFTEGHIAHDGRMSACCFDHDGRFTMGDLTEQSFMEAWHSEKFQALRRAHLARDVTGTVCEKCVA